jgi:signal transduction histidine kinase
MIDEQQFLLAALPPTQGQIRLALSVSAVLLVVFGVTAPFANNQWPRTYAFVPTQVGICAVNDLITSALLFGQYFIARRWALLVLAIGFLYTSLIGIPYALSFPGALSPTGFLFGGVQSSPWLFYFWKAGLPLAVIAYAVLKDASGGTSKSESSPKVVIFWSVAAVIAIVCGLTWFALESDVLLPRIITAMDPNGVSFDRGINPVIALCFLSLIAVAIALLWIRRRSVLDLWLMVLCCVLMLEIMMSSVLVTARFNFGWYAGRLYTVAASIVVLLVLLSETTAIYVALAHSVIRQRRDRDGRVIAMEAMAASIAHEIRQPLGAMVTFANAGHRWLTHTPPNLDEALLALRRVATDGHRAAGVLTSLREMFKKDAHGRVSFNVNELAREVLAMLDIDLRTQQISVSINLTDGIPPVVGDRGQIQQVFLNLIMNAIEAMDTVTDRARVLWVSSNTIQAASGVMVTIEDSGTGIKGDDADRIFEPFFTTRTGGTGVGLAICRSIVEAHEGTLGAFANKPYGTIFRVALPTATHA